MVKPLRSLAAFAPLALAACASVPAQQVQVSGALPPAGRYVLVQPDPAGSAQVGPAAAALEACLGSAGFASGQPAALLAQIGHAVRPARAQVVLAGTEPARTGRKPGARRDQEELTLALTDPATGALLWRGTVLSLLRKGEQPGDGASLVAPLCGALTAGRVAASH